MSSARDRLRAKATGSPAKPRQQKAREPAKAEPRSPPTNNVQSMALSQNARRYLDNLDSVNATLTKIDEDYGIGSPTKPGEDFRVPSPKELARLKAIQITEEMGTCLLFIRYYTWHLRAAEGKLAAFKEREKILKKLLKEHGTPESDTHPQMLAYRKEHLEWDIRKDALSDATDGARKYYAVLSRSQSRLESESRKFGR